WDGVLAGCPITISFVACRNELDGTRVASFVLSNRSAQIVTFIADKAGLPCYKVYEAFRIPGTTSLSFTITNHNLQEFLQSKPAVLQPQSSIVFPVRIGPKVTNETIMISYMTPSICIRQLVRDLSYLFRENSPAEAYSHYA